MAKTEGGLRVAGGFKGSELEGRPLVSVVTVCLNSEKHIEECIESVLSQTYGNLEYIIVDGGSTDRTLEIVRGFEDRLAYWVSEPDEGLYDAMNKGVELARGELVGIINSDDSYFPHTVEEVVKASLEHPEADIFHGDMDYVGPEGELKARFKGSFDRFLEDLILFHPTVFVRGSVYDRYRFNSELFPLGADIDLMLRLYSAGYAFHKVDLPLARFRSGGASSHYYPRWREVYRLRKEHGLIGPWEYLYRRFELVIKAALVRLKMEIERVFFKEHAVILRDRDYLYTDNAAMKEEIARAAAHIEKIERELAIRDAEIEKLRGNPDDR